MVMRNAHFFSTLDATHKGMHLEWWTKKTVGAGRKNRMKHDTFEIYSNSTQDFKEMHSKIRVIQIDIINSHSQL